MRSPKPLRRMGRALLAVVAMILIIEEWLWDHLRAALDYALAKLPLERLKIAVRDFIVARSPYESLVLFVLPILTLVPLKIVGLWLFATGHWFLGIGNLLLAKLLGMAATAVLFQLTKSKLLSLPWFRVVFETVTAWLAWAHARLEPTLEKVRRTLRRVRERLLLRMDAGRGSAAVFRRFVRRAKFRSSRGRSKGE